MSECSYCTNFYHSYHMHCSYLFYNLRIFFPGLPSDVVQKHLPNEWKNEKVKLWINTSDCGVEGFFQILLARLLKIYLFLPVWIIPTQMSRLKICIFSSENATVPNIYTQGTPRLTERKGSLLEPLSLTRAGWWHFPCCNATLYFGLGLLIG